MRRPRFLPILTSLLCAGASLHVVADSEFSIAVGAGAVQTDTSETSPKNGSELNAESGQLFSRSLAAEFITDKGYFIGGGIFNADGDVDYKGVSQLGTPIPNGSTYLYIWNNNVYFGKELKQLVVKPRFWIDLGGQLKERHISPNVNGISGYQEDYTWWYVGLGAEVKILGNERYAWTTGSTYKSMIDPTNKISQPKFELELGTTASYTVYTQLTYLLGAGFYLDAKLGFTSTQIALSREQYIGKSTNPIVQPESSWRDLDVMVKVSKRF